MCLSANPNNAEHMESADETSQDYLDVAAHFGRIPDEGRVCVCPCLHARHNYFEAVAAAILCMNRLH